MQINGLGNHSADMHQVTECFHNHDTKRETGGLKMAPKQAAVQQQKPETALSQDGKFSLSAWVQKLLSGGKGLLGRLWGSNAVNAEQSATEAAKAAGQSMEALGAQQVVTPLTAPGEEHKLTANGEKLVNPYFVEVDNNSQATENLWQKMRSKVQNITGNLRKKFSGRNSFQTGAQEQPKEDLRRHSRYRKENEEIDCILTDDSYLMDSYDRKGEYSKLSTKK